MSGEIRKVRKAEELVAKLNKEHPTISPEHMSCRCSLLVFSPFLCDLDCVGCFPGQSSSFPYKCVLILLLTDQLASQAI